jgi:twinkle protein
MVVVMKVLGEKGILAFEKRKISPELAANFEIYTAAPSINGTVVPDPMGSVVVFPYHYRGAIVNEKFRAPGKRFWQWPKAKARQVFYNADVLDDPALENGSQALIITEGELDCLTAIGCGFPFAVSVPAGAPPARFDAEEAQVPADPENERTGRFEFLWAHRDRIKRIKRFVLAVDADPAGQQLAAELVRRLTAARCYFVEYPAGSKDLNDVLMKHGPEAVTAVLNGAKPYPVRGLYRLSDYPAEAGSLEAVTTGWPVLDPHLKIIPGEFMVVTGIPSHGKSSFALHLLCNLARLHQWRSVIFSPEMPTVPYLRDRLRRIIESDDSDPEAFINYFFRFIGSDPTGRMDEDFDLEFIIDKATDAVLRDGVRVLLLDPWNEVEHARGKYESVTDYIGRAIRLLKRFARLHDVTVIVVCHPTKEVGREGKSRRPTLYDCDGSAHWYNKPDHGVIIHRLDDATTNAAIYIDKSRFEQAGERGKVTLRYDRASCRFEPLDNQADDF